MTETFLIRNDRLRALSATRQGRVSIAGYNYQAAYAVARLAAMSVRQPVLDLGDWPQRLRYDWGEDLDEACDDGTVRFTQCKRVATIGQPSALADVLLGFAPKWLWAPEPERDRLRFRLVCSDPRFATRGTSLDAVKADVGKRFLTLLNEPLGPQSDRATWAADARAVDHEVLFEALWNRFDCLYLSSDVVDSEPAGPRLAAEKEALRVLLERGRIDSSGQRQVLARMRRLIHDNLIIFDPANESVLQSFDRGPRILERADVDAAIDPWRPATRRQPPFQLVDRTFLSEQRELERQQFVARQPDWCDVTHGRDETIKFIERDQTEVLEAAVLEKVVARIGRAGKLPTLFVTGAPGDGKTTIVRRVVARLVDAGKLLVADTGVGLREPPGEPDEYVEAIERLQSFGRPVVLLLDDPLYAESPWLAVLKKLTRPGLQVGVLAASPQFLLDEHKPRLRACELSTFEMARTSQNERESLARLYGRSAWSETEEDFLVVAMETAAGIPFHEIIDRLWLTLADGRDLSSARSLPDLPWQTRAYLFVCFFSRAYEVCPEPLLLKLLEMTGGVPGTSDVSTELQRLKHFAGWRIFLLGHPPRERWTHGRTFACVHQLVAKEAWRLRPLRFLDIGDFVATASVAAQTSSSWVSALTARLLQSGDPEGSSLVRRLATLWNAAAKSGLVEGRNFWYFVSSLGHGRKHDEARLFTPGLQALTSRADAQSWLSALQLRYLSTDDRDTQAFPEDINLIVIIGVADFSLAPLRAIHFANCLRPNSLEREAFVERLIRALMKKTPWDIDSLLLTWLMSRAPSALPRHAPYVWRWLEEHEEDTSVRAQYLSFLRQLPPEFSALRADAARRTAKWLAVHEEDTSVRAQFLTFLSQMMPIGEWSQLASDSLNDAATLTLRAGWPRRHEVLVSSFPGLHLALLRSLKLQGSEIVRDVLKLSHDVAAEWCKRNPSSGLQLDLPLP